MYHRIIEKGESGTYLQDAMYVDPSTFRSQMDYINENFQVLPLRSVPGRMMSRQNTGVLKPLCFITFDDGWNDFYENAYPVLKQLNLPATVFLPTDFIGTNKSLWTDKVARLLTEKERKLKQDRGVGKRTGDRQGDMVPTDKSVQVQIEQTIVRLKSLPSEKIERAIEEWERDWDIAPHIGKRSFLSWEEAKEMHRSGIIEFGSHSRSHRILTTASDDVVRDELIQSREILVDQGVASPEFIPLAYPNGNHTTRIENMVKETGYHMAVTTKAGWNQVADYRKDCFRLKRIGIHQDVTSSNAMLACRIEGIY